MKKKKMKKWKNEKKTTKYYMTIAIIMKSIQFAPKYAEISKFHFLKELCKYIEIKKHFF